MKGQKVNEERQGEEIDRMKEDSLIPRVRFVEQQLFSYGGRSYSRGLTPTTKKKVIVIIHVVTPATLRLTLPHYFLPFPHIMHTAFYTHTDCFRYTYGPLNYVGVMVSAHAIHLLLASSLLIFVLSTVEVVQRLASLAFLQCRRSLQLHTVSITPCRSVPFPVWLPQSGVRLLYHTQDYVLLTCSSGALYIC